MHEEELMHAISFLQTTDMPPTPDKSDTMIELA